MPLYFGLPVVCKEAFRLFSLNFEEVKSEVMRKYKLSENMYMDCYFVDYLNAFFEREKMDIRIFYTDKGQCIVGYEIIEVNIFQKNYINVSKFVTLLQYLKTAYAQTTAKYIENFSEVELEHMEDEPETVKFPEPFIIDFNH
jgi:hypothetical protein